MRLASSRFLLLHHPETAPPARSRAMASLAACRPAFHSPALDSTSPHRSSASSLPSLDRLLTSFFPPRLSHCCFSSSNPASDVAYLQPSVPPKRVPDVRCTVAFQVHKRVYSRKESSSSICPGCGVLMQDKNPNAPGYFKKPLRLIEAVEDEEDVEDKEDFMNLEEEDEEEEHGDEEDPEEPEMGPGWKWVPLADEEAEDWKKSLDGFGPAGPEYGSGSDGGDGSGWNQVGGLSGKMMREKHEDTKDQSEKIVVCVRCHALRNYGKVKDETLENLLPDFDFDRTVGARLMKTHATRAVVLMVVDSADFDGSFPRKAASLLSEVDEREGAAWQENKSGNVPRLVLVVNKIDLLPKQVSPTRLEHWVRRRAKEGGAPRLSGLFLVSAMKSWGIKSVAKSIKGMAGPRGEVWVVGAQNAGKSSLINALAKVEEGAKVTQLTEAPVPGTTLGILRLDGILPAKAKLFDTPGLLHPHQITVRLSREEQKMVQVRKELKPRTYRVKVNDTIHVGGLVRLDVKEAPGSSIYITVWGSSLITCHLGKTERATDIFEKHVGDKLQPPFNKERLEELGPWVRTPVKVTGDSWDRSSVDIAVSGMGWFGLGLKGTAKLDVWTYEGVAITTRNALVLDMASTFEKAGFTIVHGGASKVK